jgi:hypothetical protein
VDSIVSIFNMGFSSTFGNLLPQASFTTLAMRCFRKTAHRYRHRVTGRPKSDRSEGLDGSAQTVTFQVQSASKDGIIENGDAL